MLQILSELKTLNQTKSSIQYGLHVYSINV